MPKFYIFSDIGELFIGISVAPISRIWTDDDRGLQIGYHPWCQTPRNDSAFTVMQMNPIIASGCWSLTPTRVVSQFICVQDPMPGSVIY